MIGRHIIHLVEVFYLRFRYIYHQNISSFMLSTGISSVIWTVAKTKYKILLFQTIQNYLKYVRIIQTLNFRRRKLYQFGTMAIRH